MQRRISSYSLFGVFVLLLVMGCHSNGEDQKKPDILLLSDQQHLAEAKGDTLSFKIQPGSRLTARIVFSNAIADADSAGVFHIEWLDAEGKAIFLKQMNWPGPDSSLSLTSQIRLSPDSREPGLYEVRVYRFRNFIASRSFRLIPEFPEDIVAGIPLTSSVLKLSAKTAVRSGQDSIFYLWPDNHLTSQWQLEIPDTLVGEPFFTELTWFSAEGKTIYKKSHHITSGLPVNRIESRISLSAKSRSAGFYSVTASLFRQPVLSRDFVVVDPFADSLRKYLDKIAVDLKITQKKNEDNSDNRFNLSNKRRIKAKATLHIPAPLTDKPLYFSIGWYDGKNKRFYRKHFNRFALKPKTILRSSISASAKKRNPGLYQIKIYAGDQLLHQDSFTLAKNTKR
jgi:hypothetical protein